MGRVSYFPLNTLTVHEIKNAFANVDLTEIFFRGGWPELYIDRTVSPVVYFNDYIRSYIEKDIVLSAGVLKQSAFGMVLALLAARTGQLLDYANIPRDSGIQGVTVKEWISRLERMALVQYLKPYENNRNKRLTKTPKFYFMDTGLAVRLQGWQKRTPLLTSPQTGALFETLGFRKSSNSFTVTEKTVKLIFAHQGGRGDRFPDPRGFRVRLGPRCRDESSVDTGRQAS